MIKVTNPGVLTNVQRVHTSLRCVPLTSLTIPKPLRKVWWNRPIVFVPENLCDSTLPLESRCVTTQDGPKCCRERKKCAHLLYLVWQVRQHTNPSGNSARDDNWTNSFVFVLFLSTTGFMLPIRHSQSKHQMNQLLSFVTAISFSPFLQSSSCLCYFYLFTNCLQAVWNSKEKVRKGDCSVCDVLLSHDAPASSSKHIKPIFGFSCVEEVGISGRNLCGTGAANSGANSASERIFSYSNDFTQDLHQCKHQLMTTVNPVNETSEWFGI